jgi:nucleoside-diphosphate-sugar epimerase
MNYSSQLSPWVGGRMGGCVVVTGGAGFLRSDLCGRLVADGRDMLCLDDLLGSSPPRDRNDLTQLAS